MYYHEMNVRCIFMAKFSEFPCRVDASMECLVSFLMPSLSADRPDATKSTASGNYPRRAWPL